MSRLLTAPAQRPAHAGRTAEVWETRNRVAGPLVCLFHHPSDLFGLVPFLLASTVPREVELSGGILPLWLTSPSLSLPAVQFLSV